MIQGREFTDIEQNFIGFVTDNIQKGQFDAFLQDIEIDKDTLIETLEVTGLYDYDYLDLHGELNADEIFTDITSQYAVLQTLSICEVMTLRIPNDKEENILFISIGESQMPGISYTCYAYGFITENKRRGKRYYFENLTYFV